MKMGDCLFTMAFLSAALTGVVLGDAPAPAAEVRETFPPFNEAWPSSDPEAQVLTESGLELRTPGAAYAWRDVRLTETSIQAEIIPGDADAIFLGVRVQETPPLSGYVLDVTREGRVSLVTLVEGEDTELAVGRTGLVFTEEVFVFCLSLQGQRLRGWVWLREEDRPAEPTVEVLLPAPLVHGDGRPAVGVRGGNVTFTKVEIGGERFRPKPLGVLPIRPEVRLRLIWEAEPGEVYRIDATPNRVSWHTRYWVRAAESTVDVVVPGSFTAEPSSGMLFRIVRVSASVQVPADLEVLTPRAPRFVLAWSSADDRIYGFEWSSDLENWASFGGLVVPGADGLSATATVLPLPETVDPRDVDSLFFRVVDQEDRITFGLVPPAVEP